MKPDKVLCCMFSFPFFGLDRALNTIAVYSVLRELANRNVLVT